MPWLAACDLDLQVGELPETDEGGLNCIPDAGSSEGPPVMALIGPATQALECGSSYTDPGAKATDACFGDLTSSIVRVGSVNSEVPGSYTLTYNVTNPAGQVATPVQRMVTVSDTLPPTLAVNGSSSLALECGTVFTDPGAVATDQCFGALPVVTSGTVDPNVPGHYTLAYQATDAAGNTVSASRSVEVSDTLPPTLTLLGSQHLNVECGGAFADPGAAATDACLGDLTAAITRVGSVSSTIPGHYMLTYFVGDGQRSVTATRLVTVIDVQPPVLKILGPLSQSIECGTPYVDPGATATDACAGDLSAAIVATRTGDPSSPGVVSITYSVSDPFGNSTTSPLSRTVRVSDTEKPVITLVGPETAVMECGTTFVDPGATAMDACFGNLTSQIIRSGTVQANMPGAYTLAYDVKDSVFNWADPVTRTVVVDDTLQPTLVLNGPSTLTHQCGTAFVDPGAVATDQCEGGLPVTASGAVNANVPNTYTLVYHAEDSVFNEVSLTRMVNVFDNVKPEIQVLPGSSIIECNGTPYVDPGATASDLCAGDVTQSIVVNSDLDQSRPGVYTISYTVADAYGNVSTASRSITVGPCSLTPSSPREPAARLAELSGLSSQLAGLTANGTAEFEVPGSILLRGTAPGLNVFELDVRALTDATRLLIDAPAGSLGVVNIHGDSARFAGLEPTFLGGIDKHGVLYNFVDATDIHADRCEFEGTVLAPHGRIHLQGGSGDDSTPGAARCSEMEGVWMRP
ncbi:immunoglobulin-like domain-containing protein [Hyalangium versicolor]|uniref:immunoglobulin-like domain-containing protein n=1 Tax=Hyalangium versicolor TaxID=2861190 RepID=UPI001CCCB4FD|nr:immunoglobulin-like domain-containing protein [Hyalangium versicolor]